VPTVPYQRLGQQQKEENQWYEAAPSVLNYVRNKGNVPVEHAGDKEKQQHVKLIKVCA